MRALRRGGPNWLRYSGSVSSEFHRFWARTRVAPLTGICWLNFAPPRRKNCVITGRFKRTWTGWIGIGPASGRPLGSPRGYFNPPARARSARIQLTSPGDGAPTDTHSPSTSVTACFISSSTRPARKSRNPEAPPSRLSMTAPPHVARKHGPIRVATPLCGVNCIGKTRCAE